MVVWVGFLSTEARRRGGDRYVLLLPGELLNGAFFGSRSAVPVAENRFTSNFGHSSVPHNSVDLSALGYINRQCR